MPTPDKPIRVRGWVLLSPAGKFEPPDLFFADEGSAQHAAWRNDKVRRATLTIEPKARKRAKAK